MSSPEILLIDDDRRLADMVGRYLGQAGFAVQHQGTAREGLEALGCQVPGLVLLDLMLPDGDGLDVCRQIRQMSGAAATVPVLMLTARGETTDRIVGLEIGADDYLPKPFEPRELLARVRALLRRASAPHAADPAAAGEGQGGAATAAGVSGAAGQTGARQLPVAQVLRQAAVPPRGELLHVVPPWRTTIPRCWCWMIWRSTRGPARCVWRARNARSPATSSICCWRWRAMPAG